ncbi:glutathione S-transferase 1-like [Cloeon dipterum]|uniref:glutathione S-transferase 1-like n=1 Tax=Cloeon dipterum TaxID=197152 RepID=UPI0032208562
MPLVLHCIDGSPPNRAVYLCLKALGLEATKKTVNLFKMEHHNPEFLKLNPQHTTPTLEDDDFVIWDSHAICCYLVNKYAKDDSLYPTDPHKRAIVDQRLHFNSGFLFPRFFNISFPLIFLKCKEISEEKQKAVKEGFAFLEKFLEGNDYLAGPSYTLADICCVATVSTLVEGLRCSVDSYPNVQAWMKRCRENLPGYAEVNQPGLDAYKRAADRELD